MSTATIERPKAIDERTLLPEVGTLYPLSKLADSRPADKLFCSVSAKDGVHLADAGTGKVRRTKSGTSELGVMWIYCAKHDPSKTSASKDGMEKISTPDQERAVRAEQDDNPNAPASAKSDPPVTGNKRPAHSRKRTAKKTAASKK